MEENKVEFQLYIKNSRGKWESCGRPGHDLDEKIGIVKAMNDGANGERTYEGRVVEIYTRTSVAWEG